jgi:hypothetical protein
VRLLLLFLILLTACSSEPNESNPFYQELNAKNLNPTATIVKEKYFDRPTYYLYLTPFNTILHPDKKFSEDVNYRQIVLNQHSTNFQVYGQFEIMVPSQVFPVIPDNYKYKCDGENLKIRMGQSKKDQKEKIQASQDIFFKIKDMVDSQAGAVKVRVAIKQEDYHGCTTVYFYGVDGEYIKSLEQIKK